MQCHLVHVGKCGGESVIEALHPQIGNLSVYHTAEGPDAVARRVLARDPADVFVVLWRETAARFVSAFEWDLHSKSLGGDGRRMRNARWQRVYRAFRNANVLAEALTDADAERRGEAEFALRDSKLHIQYDLGWYLPAHVAAELPAGRTHIIRTERLESDLRIFMEGAGLDFRGVRRRKSDYKRHLPPGRLTAALSARARRNIVLASHATAATERVIAARLAPDGAVLGP